MSGEHAPIANQGGSVWNVWRRQHPGKKPELYRASLVGRNLDHARLNEANLRRAVLSRATLKAANLTNAKLEGADCNHTDLTKAKLIGADMSYANLGKANLRGANCTGAHFLWANLRGADLRGANLSRAILVGTNLTGADLADVTLDGAFVGSTLFADLDLRSVRGLSSVKHRAPSTVGVNTLFRSEGKIPEDFLSGTGVPDTVITYMRSLVNNPIKFYSCFISYASDDQTFAERLHADLQAKRVQCWFAPEDLTIGDRFHQRIEESILVFDKVMIVLSENSVQSRWVEREVNAAIEREDREKRTVLFPIRIDDSVVHATQPWAADIRRSRHIGDFRGWKEHDAYVKALDRLLRDLKASEESRH